MLLVLGMGTMTDVRAEVVGSLLRPQYLVDARKQLEAGELAPAGYKAIEDQAVDEATPFRQRRASTSSPTASNAATRSTGTLSSPFRVLTNLAAGLSPFATSWANSWCSGGRL